MLLNHLAEDEKCALTEVTSDPTPAGEYVPDAMDSRVGRDMNQLTSIARVVAPARGLPQTMAVRSPWGEAVMSPVPNQEGGSSEISSEERASAESQ